MISSGGIACIISAKLPELCHLHEKRVMFAAKLAPGGASVIKRGRGDTRTRVKSCAACVARVSRITCLGCGSLVL